MQFRYLYKKLEKHLAHKNYTIVTGARQVGKTSLLRQLYSYLLENGEDASLLNLEDKDLLAELDANPKSVFNLVKTKPKRIIEGKQKQRIYLLIDEIQYLEDPTNFLKLLYDEYEYNVKIVATGSSAFYIDRKFKDSLVGRKQIFHLFPLSFNEFVVFKRSPKINTEISFMVSEPNYKSGYQMNIKGLLMEYLRYGGYPAVVLEDDEDEKIRLLDDIKNSYLRRDIIESGITKENKFFMLIKLLADQVGNLVNNNELGNTLGLDNKTVENYIYILQKCFHVDLVRPYHSNLRKELTKMPKLYFNDIGLRNAILDRFENARHRMDRGMLFENFIYTQLRIKHKPNAIHFWRTIGGNEVDFVIEEEYNKGYALEVKWECSKYKASKYKKFVATYPDFPLSCIDIDNSEILTY